MKILKKILLIIVVFLSALIVSQTTSKAQRIEFGKNSGILSIHEQDYQVDNYDLKLGLNYTFCVQHGQHAREGATWRVQNYIKIEGRTCKIYRNNSNADSDLLAERENDENLMFSWMLNHSDPGSIMWSGATEEAAEKYLSNYDPNSSLWLHVAGGGKKYSVNQQAVYGYFPTWAAANDYTIVTSGGRNQLS